MWNVDDNFWAEIKCAASLAGKRPPVTQLKGFVLRNLLHVMSHDVTSVSLNYVGKILLTDAPLSIYFIHDDDDDDYNKNS